MSNIQDFSSCNELESNYCIKCWVEFTTMSPEELDNYKKLRNHYDIRETPYPYVDNYYKNNYKRLIQCQDTGEYYNSITDCAVKIGAAHSTLSRHLSKGYPQTVFGKVYKYAE